MSSFDKEKYESAKAKAHEFYSANKKLHSKKFGEVHLTSDGFMHLIYADRRLKKKRDWKNQLKRFNLLPLIKIIIRDMPLYQEYSEGLESVVIKDKKKRVKTSKIVRYWGIVAIVSLKRKIRLKIILRQVGNGNIHFWSIIPYWKISHYREITLLKIHEGDLCRD